MIFLNLYTKSQKTSGLQIPCCIGVFFQTDKIFFDQFRFLKVRFKTHGRVGIMDATNN